MSEKTLARERADEMSVPREQIEELIAKSGLVALQAPFDQTIKPQLTDQPIAETSAPQTRTLCQERSVDDEVARLPFLPLQRDGSTQEGGKPADFSLLSLLGEGGMGEVSLAAQRSLEREVAIKSLKPEAPSSLATQSLLHEGRIMGALSHPNILPVYALGHDEEGRPVLVMKRVEGASWLALLADPGHPFWGQEPLSKEEQQIRHLEILMDVCNAVAFAHEKGIIHRDIKPENVMIGAFGEVLLLDWGLALRLSEQGQQTEQKGPFVGTPSYMAPEMVGGTLSPQTDVYLLGSTLHFILTGLPRHHGANIYQVLFSVTDAAPIAYPKHISADLGAISNKATHKDPAKRYPTAIAFQQALAGYLRHRGSLQLTDEAHHRLEELRGLIEQEAHNPQREEQSLHRRSHLEVLLSECQFGFMQALQQWPENPRAEAGLQDCFTFMCRHELHHKSLERAETYFARIDAPSQALVEQIETLRQERQEEAREAEKLKEEFNFERKSYPRFLFFGAMIVLVLLGLFGSMAQGESVNTMNYQDAIGLDVILLATYGLILGWRRKVLLSRHIDRRFYLFIGICFLSGFLHHIIAYKLQLPLRISNISEGVTFTLLCLFAGMSIRPWFYVGTIVSGISSSLMLLFPAYHAALYTFDGIFLLFFIAALSYSQSTGQERLA